MAALLIERLLKVVTPELAVWVSVPERVPPPGLLPIATVTVVELSAADDVAERVLDRDLDGRG